MMLQIDSLMLQRVIHGIWKPPWQIWRWTEEIKSIMTRCQMQISHLLREGNKVVDYLANIALDRVNVKYIIAFINSKLKEGS